MHELAAVDRGRCERSQGQGRLQRVAVALWAPDEAAALCDRKRMRSLSGVNLGLRALLNVGVRHLEPDSCVRFTGGHSEVTTVLCDPSPSCFTQTNALQTSVQFVYAEDMCNHR